AWGAAAWVAAVPGVDVPTMSAATRITATGSRDGPRREGQRANRESTDPPLSDRDGLRQPAAGDVKGLEIRVPVDRRAVLRQKRGGERAKDVVDLGDSGVPHLRLHVITEMSEGLDRGIQDRALHHGLRVW